jgi:Short C-terminal domain/Phospholipase_D-nuclease N-terminal
MSYPLLDAFLTMLWLFLWILWIVIVVRVVFDIFGSQNLSGWAKAGWVILVVALPLIGVLCYVIVHGGDMQDRQLRQADAQDGALGSYRQDIAGDGSADELAKLADLRDRGVISEAEFQQGKARVLS